MFFDELENHWILYMTSMKRSRAFKRRVSLVAVVTAVLLDRSGELILNGPGAVGDSIPGVFDLIAEEVEAYDRIRQEKQLNPRLHALDYLVEDRALRLPNVRIDHDLEISLQT